jgi:multidrug efflux pump subunit AcrA (membrane-fusion protein)
MTARGLVCGLLLGAQCLGCSQPVQREPIEQEPEAAPSAAARWLTPEPASRVAWLEAPARALPTPEATHAVSVPLSARVLRVRVRPGQTVKKDEPLVDVLLPELLGAAGALSAARLRIESYEARKSRLGPLVEQGLARTAELNELEANLALARAERELARATLRVAGVSEGQVPALLQGQGAISLRAPIGGMVVSVSGRAGEVREPGSGPLLELVSPGLVQIEARLGLTPPVGASFEWWSGAERVPLELEALSPRAAPEDGTRLAWFRTREPQRAPLAGSLGRVRLVPDASWRVVPAAALREQGNSASVVVLGDRAPREQPVQVVLRSASEVIVSGLAPDLRVAADAARAPLEKSP